MKRVTTVLVAAAVLATAGCQRSQWFEGSLEDALVLAGQKDALIMASFFTDW